MIMSALLKNTVKTPKAKGPDYRIIGDKLGECGAGWNKVGITSGKRLFQSHWSTPISVTVKSMAAQAWLKGLKTNLSR